MFYLCKRNGYGDVNIVTKLENTLDLIELAIKSVTKDNMENSLALDEKLKDFKSVFPIGYNVDGERINNVVYAGTGALGKHVFYYINPENNDLEITPVDNLTDVTIKFFIGTDNKKDHYLKDYVSKSRNKEQYDVGGFNSTLLEKRSFYFIKKV